MSPEKNSEHTDASTNGAAPVPAAASPGSTVTPGGDVHAQSTGTGVAPTDDAAPSLFAPRKPLEVVEVRTGMFGVHGSGDTSGYGGLTRQVVMQRTSPRPYGGWYDEAVDVLGEVLAEAGVAFDTAVESVVVDPPFESSRYSELTLHVAREHIVAVCQALRDDQDLRFEMSLGVSGVHYPHENGRELHAVYHLTSVTHSRSLRLEVSVPDADPHIPSTTTVYPTNDWHERETWDFFGIVFDGHPALARIEMPDDWPGHPQRKDYPLGGIPVEYKGATVPPADQRRSYS